MVEDHSKRKKIIIISTVIGIILLIILAASYFGVLSPARMTPEGNLYSESSSISIEVKHGNYVNAETSLRKMISDAGAEIYQENVNEYSGRRSGRFTIDVINSSSDSLINQFRTLGQVTSFSYSKGKYQQEYYSYDNTGLKEGYVRITVWLREKDSMFSSLNNLEGSDLGSTFSGSIVALFYFIVAVLPWAIVITLIIILVRYIKRKFFD